MSQMPVVEDASPSAEASSAAEGGPLGIKGLAWAIFEGARNPYYNLIVIYIFAPYFANVMVGGGELGLRQAGADGAPRLRSGSAGDEREHRLQERAPCWRGDRTTDERGVR